MATITPPFGLSQFVMREVYRSALPFITLNILVMGLKIAFPSIVQWLPAHMK